MLQKRIEAQINGYRDEIIGAIKALVRIPSVTADPLPGMPYGKEASRALEAALEIADGLGFSTKNYDSYVGAIDFSAAEKGLDILAHLDIVPAPAEKWTVCQPFEPIVKDGKIYGRGASDDKGPAMAALFAMKAIKDLEIPLKKNVRLILGTDEECGGSDIDYYYTIEQVAPATFSPDADFPVINVEKGRIAAKINASYAAPRQSPLLVSAQCGVSTNVIPDSAEAVVKGFDKSTILAISSEWEQELGQKLIINEEDDNLLLTIKGKGGHAASPAGGNNALTGMLNLLCRLPFGDNDQTAKLKGLAELFPHGDWSGKAAGIAMADEVSDDLTISLNMFQLDDKGFSATFDSRTPVMSTDENTSLVLVENLGKYGLELEVQRKALPHHVDKNSPFIKVLNAAYEQYSGLMGYCQIIGGGTYVHGLNNAVAFGASMPGTDNLAHGADEFAVIDELLLSAKIFTQVIVDMCG